MYIGVKNFVPFSFNAYRICEDYSEESFKNMKEMFMLVVNRSFFDDTVLWYSDAEVMEDACYLRIEKLEECYKIIFGKSKDYKCLVYSIRFRNSRSRYNPYNCLFMHMYNKLCEYDINYHQIHMEEYLYQKKLKRK